MLTFHVGQEASLVQGLLVPGLHVGLELHHPSEARVCFTAYNVQNSEGDPQVEAHAGISVCHAQVLFGKVLGSHH